MSTKNNKNNKAAEEKTSVVINVRGTLTNAFFGRRSFKKGGDKEDKFRYSLKILPEDMERLKEAAAPFYEDVDSQWIPKFLTSDDEKDLEFINLASNYDIAAGIKLEGDTEMKDIGKLMDYIGANGNINGSKVIMALVIKEGAIYPQGILIKELHKQSISDMFMSVDEELPF